MKGNFCAHLCRGPSKYELSLGVSYCFFFSSKSVFFFFVFFFFLEKFTSYSFIQFQSCVFFFRCGKKKTVFSFIHSIFAKNAQKRTFPSKTKYDTFEWSTRLLKYPIFRFFSIRKYSIEFTRFKKGAF